MGKSKPKNIASSDLWTSNSKQIYEVGGYPELIEMSIEAVKAKPKNTALYDRLKEQMVEFLYFTFEERQNHPLDNCAKLAKYAAQGQKLFSDAANVKWWQTCLESTRYIAEFGTKNQDLIRGNRKKAK